MWSLGCPGPITRHTPWTSCAGATPSWEFRIIIGEDNLRTLQQWARWRELVDGVGFLVYPRAKSEERRSESQRAPSLPTAADIVLSPAPIISISSTYLRSALANGDSARYLLPDGAADLIREKGLYGFKAPSRDRAQDSGVVEGVHRALQPDKGKGAQEGRGAFKPLLQRLLLFRRKVPQDMVHLAARPKVCPYAKPQTGIDIVAETASVCP